MAQIKPYVDYKQLAQHYMNKYAPKGVVMAEAKKAELDKIILDEIHNIPNGVFNDVIHIKKNIDWDWWGAPPDKAQAQMEQFFEIPNPAKFVEPEPVLLEPKVPDPYTDNLQNVTKELQEIVDFAFANGEEPPLTLIRALNRINALEKGGDDWIAGYNVGWADAGGDKHQDDLPPIPDDDV